ncbi:regulatory protein GntR [Mycolicibacterium brisbanense]|uniref:Regulatory protein GntR n=1 Tax=Mycolicibacterium brisbanense TaxID=146020 RepID=A0A124E009_9MYCO|nr:GntR family transcriptional regulator [Mycolicibacterium brisbanense]GAS89058.1 regulatory protein GntR [Mycolicibacterium brisbanense]
MFAEEETQVSSLSPLVASEAPVGRADEIVQRITEAIHLGLLDDGERLPVEIDLAAQFGVAPMTVREALATLREQQLVETRRGRSGGSFVRRPEGPPIDQLTARLAAMSASDLRDLFDEHTAIAGLAARLAAQRAAPYAVRRLFALTDQLDAATTLGDRIRADSRFQIQVAIASQSARLARREANLQAEVAGLIWLPLGPPLDVAAYVEEQHAIAAAVASENADEARRLAEAHVMGQLARLTTVNLDLTTQESGS